VNTGNQARHTSTQGGNRGATLRIHNVTICSFTSRLLQHRGNNHRYPGGRRCGRSQSQHGELRREKSLAASGNRTPDSAI